MDLPALPARQSRSESVCDALEAQIATDGIQAGARLGTKQELRGRYKVAPATLNEALRILETRGIVELRPGPGGGVFAANQPAMVRFGRKLLTLGGEPAGVADSLAVRQALEPLVVGDAVRYRADPDIAELRTLLERMVASETAREYLRTNWALHRRIAEITPNRMLSYIYRGLLDYAEERIQHITANPADDLRNGGIEVHRDLVEAIAAADPTAAAACLAAHHMLTTSSADPPTWNADYADP